MDSYLDKNLDNEKELHVYDSDESDDIDNDSSEEAKLSGEEDNKK